MKKLLIFTLFIIFNFSIVSAQTIENSITLKLKELTLITSSQKAEKIDTAIDHAIQIFNYNPSSIESYYALFWLLQITCPQNMVDKSNSLKRLYYPSITNFSSNQAEKIVLILLLGSGVECDNLNSAEQSFNKSIEMLKKAQLSCNDDKFIPLLKFLLTFDKVNGTQYTIDFKKNYPNHPWIPFADLILVGDLLNKKEYQRCINDSTKLIEKYNDLKTPYGWKLIVDYYNLLVLCYLDLRDFNNVNKYINLIKKEAPNYYQLKNIEQMVELVRENESQVKTH